MKFNSYTSSFELITLAILGVTFLSLMVESHQISKRELMIKSITEIDPIASQELIKLSNPKVKIKNLKSIDEECNCKKFSKRNLRLKKRMSCLMCGDINNKIKEDDFELLPNKKSNELIVITPEEKLRWRKKSLGRINSLGIPKPLGIIDVITQSSKKLIKKPRPPVSKQLSTNLPPESPSFRESFNVNQHEDSQFPSLTRSYSDSFTFDLP
ncbi:hypothetical protein DFH28DRAFT_1152297 [Melampsora americana]|nr:hypothetical protein DFH28DRAFT_1152297 [Melampsora americana]